MYSSGGLSFAEEERLLKMRSTVTGCQKLTATSWEGHRSWSEVTPEVAEDLSVGLSTVSWHLKQIRKVKKLNKWVPHELTTNQKNHFEVHSSLTVRKNNKLFCDQIMMCDDKWILYGQRVMTNSVFGLRGNSKALPKAKLASEKRVTVTIWWSAADPICYSFLTCFGAAS